MPNYALSINDDLIENPSPRCACMVVLDTSGSMDGARIHQLNEGLKRFVAALQADDVASCSIDVAVITAGGVVTEQLPFHTAMNIDQLPDFSATGGTPIGQAVSLALQRLDERKKAYQQTAGNKPPHKAVNCRSNANWWCCRLGWMARTWAFWGNSPPNRPSSSLDSSSMSSLSGCLQA